MEFLLDADALIKLNRIGVLERFVMAYDCATPYAVYREVVIDARARGYRDAEELDLILSETIVVIEHAEIVGLRGLGDGESAILSLLGQWPDALPVSDDRKFQAVLASQSIAFLSTGGVLTALARQGEVSVESARDALEMLRRYIDDETRNRALQELDDMEGS